MDNLGPEGYSLWATHGWHYSGARASWGLGSLEAAPPPPLGGPPPGPGLGHLASKKGKLQQAGQVLLQEDRIAPQGGGMVPLARQGELLVGLQASPAGWGAPQPGLEAIAAG